VLRIKPESGIPTSDRPAAQPVPPELEAALNLIACYMAHNDIHSLETVILERNAIEIIGQPNERMKCKLTINRSTRFQHIVMRAPTNGNSRPATA
jgi:hypothetical protein